MDGEPVRPGLRHRARVAVLGAFLLLALAAALLAWVALRRNASVVAPELSLRHWSVVDDGQHHSNTDLLDWQGDLWLVHASSPWHLGSKRSRLVVKRSTDGRDFETLATLRVEGRDIRDPKLVAVGERLFLYALPNSGVMATPEQTVLATSEDGRDWTPFEPVGPEGWLFWRPKTRDGRAWYVPAYWHEHGESILLRSHDGRSWERVSRIHAGDANDETAIEFLPDGRLLATARLEGRADSPFGHREAATLLAVAEPPYTEWSTVRSAVTRLDGPVLFRVDGRVFAVARFQPGGRGFPNALGSMWSRKRTSLFLVEPERLVWLSDLPSAGDTSYAGVAARGDRLLVDYYTSRIDRDYPWVLGMFLPTGIRMAGLSLPGLRELAARADAEAAP